MQLGMALAKPTVSSTRQHRLVDAFEIVLRQRLVAAAFEAGAHRPDVVGQRRCPHARVAPRVRRDAATRG